MAKTQRKRAVLYLRQSTFREESISLELQETAGREHCKKHGYQVIAVKADPGISGRTWNRPAVQEVMGMIENGEAEVIVLWKWSRLSRSRRDWAIAVDRVDVAGGVIESATEPLDVATSTGRLARGLMVEFAAFESERIGDVWREAHERRVRSGRPANGKARWGYLYDKEQKLHVPDPDVAPVVKEVYERYNAGESIYSLVKYLNNHGYKTAPGYGNPTSERKWSDRILRRTLAQGFPAGYFTRHEQLVKGIHEPIIDEATWQEFLINRERRSVKGLKPRSTHLFSGMVRCGQCGYKMTAGQYREGKPYLRCNGAKEYRLHTGGYVTEPTLVMATKEWLQSNPFQRQNAAISDTPPAKETLTAKLAEIDAINERIRRLSEDVFEDLIPKDVYRSMLAEATARRDELERETLALKVESSRPDKHQITVNVLRDWDILPVHGLRKLLGDVIEELVVSPGRPRANVQVKPKE